MGFESSSDLEQFHNSQEDIRAAVKDVYDNSSLLRGIGTYEQYLRHVQDILEGKKPNCHGKTLESNSIQYHGTPPVSFDLFHTDQDGFIFYTANKVISESHYRKDWDHVVKTLIVGGNILNGEDFVKHLEKYQDILELLPEEEQSRFTFLYEKWKEKGYYDDRQVLPLTDLRENIAAIRDSGLYDGVVSPNHSPTGFDQGISFVPENVHILASDADAEQFRGSLET